MEAPNENGGNRDGVGNALDGDNTDTDTDTEEDTEEEEEKRIAIRDTRIAQLEAELAQHYRDHPELEVMTPEAWDLFKNAIKNVDVNIRNFMQWARDQLPNMNHVAQNVIAISAYLAFMHYFYVVTTEAQPSLLLSHLGSPQMVWDMAKTSAPANGGSVVDAVFAKAERKAATR